jgi:hypothetical protein
MGHGGVDNAHFSRATWYRGPEMEETDPPQLLLRPDVQITVDGLEEQLATELGTNIAAVVRAIAGQHDLRKLERFIVAYDYRAALASLDRGDSGYRPAVATDNVHGQGAGMAPIVVRDGEARSVVIVDASLVVGLLSDEKDEVSRSLQAIVHELGHVNDLAWLEGVNPDWRKPIADDLDGPLILAADRARTEYAASRFSAYLRPATGHDFVTILANVIEAAPGRIEKAIRHYRLGGDLGDLWELVRQEVEFFFQAAGYALGHLDGLLEADAESDRMTVDIQGLYEREWGKLLPDIQEALRGTYEAPTPWTAWDAYRPLMRVVVAAMEAVSIYPTRSRGGGLYVGVGRRPRWP